jgi:hypothetical protein
MRVESRNNLVDTSEARLPGGEPTATIFKVAPAQRVCRESKAAIMNNDDASNTLTHSTAYSISDIANDHLFS